VTVQIVLVGILPFGGGNQIRCPGHPSCRFERRVDSPSYYDDGRRFGFRAPRDNAEVHVLEAVSEEINTISKELENEVSKEGERIDKKPIPAPVYQDDSNKYYKNPDNGILPIVPIVKEQEKLEKKPPSDYRNSNRPDKKPVDSSKYPNKYDNPAPPMDKSDKKPAPPGDPTKYYSSKPNKPDRTQKPVQPIYPEPREYPTYSGDEKPYNWYWTPPPPFFFYPRRPMFYYYPWPRFNYQRY